MDIEKEHAVLAIPNLDRFIVLCAKVDESCVMASGKTYTTRHDEARVEGERANEVCTAT